MFDYNKNMKFYMYFFYLLLFINSALYADSSKVEQVSVQLEWKHQFEFAGFYAALDQGYYREVGLYVEIREYDPSIDIVRDVLVGRSTYGMSSSQLILERLSGKKIVQLASYLKQNALVIITKPSIKRVGDLKNRKIMAADSELESSSLAAMLHENGLSAKDLHIVPHTFTVDAFVKGEVDAMTAFISNQPFLLDQKGVSYNILNPAEEGIYSYDVELFTSEDEAKNFPTRTENFINATRRGWEYALSHKEELVELIYTKYSKEKTKEALLYEADVISDLMKTNLFQVGAVVPELVELNTNMYVTLGMAAKNWNLDGFVFGRQYHKVSFTQEELAFIKAHPVIRFSDVQWEPFASIKGSEYSGIFRTYYKLLEQRTGIRFEFVKVGDGVNFQHVLDALEDKKIDMIDGSGKTEDRERYALFAGPLMQVSLAEVLNRNSGSTASNLEEKRIVVARGSTASEYMSKKYPDKTLLYTDSIDEALEMVRQNRADLLLDNSVVLDYMIESKAYSTQVDIETIDDYEFKIYALIRNDYPLLQQIINKAVKSVTQEELLRINNKLLQSTIRPIKKKNVLGLSDKELDFIKQHPTITLGTDSTWKPYVIPHDDGTVGGYDADVLALINRASGANFVLKTGDWAQMQVDARSKKIDGLSTGGVHEERKSYLNFSDIYISMRKMLLTTKENPKNIQSLQDLDDKTIAVHSSNMVDMKIAKKFPKSKILKLESVEEVISSVVTGKADAMFGNGAVFYLANDLGMPYLKRSAMLDESLELAFGVRKDWPEAISIINKSLAYIGEYKMLELKSRWFWQEPVTAVKNSYKKLQLTDEEEAYLLHKKTITMCVDPDWMPFEKIEKRQHIGLAAEYIELIEKKIHMPISLVQTATWSESLERARSRQCDILSMVAKVDQKAQYMDFTSPYITTPMVIATQDEQLFIDDISAYMDKKWGVVKGYSVTVLLKNRYPNIKIVEVDSVSDGLKKVENGTLFGYIDNSITVSHAIQKDFLGSIAITGRLDDKVSYSIATRNDEKILHSILEKAIMSIEPSVRQQLFNKWVDVTYAAKTDYLLVWQVLFVTFLIILIIFYRYVLLRKEVKKREEAEAKLQKFTVSLSQKVYDATVDLEEKNLKLVESVYNFENIFNTTMEMIIIFEDDGTIIDINRSGLKMLGYHYKTEVVGTKISKHILESELPKVYEDLRADTHEPDELILVRRDGSELYTLKSSRRIVRDGKKVRISTLMDLTELRQQNSHLIQQSKMAAMGEMIENIAHQWRQPLSQVNSAVLLVDGLLEKKDVHDEQIEAKLSEIEELTKYMSTTINDFKDFFVQEKKIVSFMLSDVVKKSIGIANSTLQKSHIEIKLMVENETILNGYPNELQQVVLVLINNAKDALIGRNTVAPKITIIIVKNDERVSVTVCDNAGGIEDDIINKVFDPYFTTKHQTQGTGLGLYISKMIIQDSMHGTLEVQNRDEGACFTVMLNTAGSITV